MRFALPVLAASWLACAPAPPPGDADLAALRRALAEVEGLRSEPSELRESIRLRGASEVVVALVATVAAGDGWNQNEGVHCRKPVGGDTWSCSAPYLTTFASLPGREPGRNAASNVVGLDGPDAVALLEWIDALAASGEIALDEAEVATIDCVGRSDPDALWARCCPVGAPGAASFGLLRARRSEAGFELDSIQRASWAEDPAAPLQPHCDAADGPALSVE